MSIEEWQGKGAGKLHHNLRRLPSEHHPMVEEDKFAF